MQEMWDQSWVWKIPREGTGNPLQYSCLENPMYRGAWRHSLRGRKRQTEPSTHSTQEPQGDGRPIINTMHATGVSTAFPKVHIRWDFMEMGAPYV